MPTVAELDPSVDTGSIFGQTLIITPLQEALLHMLMRETGVTNAERIMTDVVQAGAGKEMIAYLSARGDIIKASVVPSEADMSKAIANRYDNCQVAKRSMKPSSHRRIDFTTEMHAFVGQNEQKPWKQLYVTTEGIIETTRALLVHRASKLVTRKIVIIGDSTAAQLAEDLSEKELITSTKMPDLIRMLTSTELMSGVQNVLVVVGRDAILADEKLETFEGQCQKLLGYLKGYPNVKVTWMVPPFVESKKEIYEEWHESIATILKNADIDLVWSTRYRSVLEITRYGNKADGHAVDNTGALTGMGRRRVLEYLIAVHRFPISGMRKDKKDQESRKRDSAQGERYNGHGGQNYYSKRRRY
ncbi:hypothetical protein AAVH_20010 [Aphelenchoides avenae]|nr:hypothetical protein AAVH_28301 [Aphelenchus avenae]KAH7712668.1 hypothetical protein AAVH_20010 [Aphelenchus avenae]